MNWASPADFFAMGGYGFYVWGSFGATLLAVLGEICWLRQRRAAIVARLRRELVVSHIDWEG